MQRRYVLGLLAGMIVVVGGTIGFVVLKRPTTSSSTNRLATPTVTSASPTATVPTATTTPTQSPTPAPAVAAPIADFKARVTKKPFGIYITPATSPVQPERFTGYHTGDDAEYTDADADIPVYAIVDATVVEANWVSGYGGLLVLKGTINGHTDYLLYGHVRQSTLPKVGERVKQGDQVGLLGTGYSTETDGERHHLHFAIYTGNPVNIRGYVPNKSDLRNWLDPLSLY